MQKSLAAGHIMRFQIHPRMKHRCKNTKITVTFDGATLAAAE